MSELKIKKTNRFDRKWEDFNNWFYNKIHRGKKRSDMSLFRKLRDVWPNWELFDYILSKYNRKRCSKCNGLGFTDC